MGSQKQQKQGRKTRQQQAGQGDPPVLQSSVQENPVQLGQDGQRYDNQHDAAAPAQQWRPGEDIETPRLPTEDAFDVDNRGQG